MKSRLKTVLFVAALSLLLPLAGMNAQEIERPKPEATEVPTVIPKDATPSEAMTLLQPAVDALSAKYKGNRTKLYQELSQLYFDAADRMIEGELNEGMFELACLHQMSGYTYLNQYAPEKYDPDDVLKFIAHARSKHPDFEIPDQVYSQFFWRKAERLLSDKEITREKYDVYRNEMKKFVTANPGNSAASMVGQFLLTARQVGEKLGDPKLADEAEKEFLTLLKSQGYELLLLVDLFTRAKEHKLADFNEIKESFDRLYERDLSPLGAYQAVKIIGFAPSVAAESGDPKFVENIGNELIKKLASAEAADIKNLAKTAENELIRAKLVGQDFTLDGIMLDGSKFDWSPYKGKVVLLDFWATWCGPCKAEIPYILELYKKYHEKGFEVIGINVWEHGLTPEEVLKTLEDQNLPWSHLDGKQSADAGFENLPQKYAIRGIPTLFLIGKDGKVVSTTVRGVTGSLQNALEEIFGE